MAIFALNIMPYISASIIIQLLTTVSPQLEALKKEGEAAQDAESVQPAISPYPGCVPVLRHRRRTRGRGNVVSDPGLFSASPPDHADRRHHVPDVLGEQITSRGIGNGIR